MPVTFDDRMLIKASYTRFDKLSTNQGNDPPLIDVTSGKRTIADLHPKYGRPWELRVPRVLLPTTKVTLGLGFLGTVAAVIGAATNYGVTLEGVAVIER